MEAMRGAPRCSSQLVNQAPSTTGRAQPAWPGRPSRQGGAAVFASTAKLRTAKGSTTAAGTVKGASTVGGKPQKSVRGGTASGAPSSDAPRPKSSGSQAYFNFTGMFFGL